MLVQAKATFEQAQDIQRVLVVVLRNSMLVGLPQTHALQSVAQLYTYHTILISQLIDELMN